MTQEKLPSFDDILTAKTLIQNSIPVTPTVHAHNLSYDLGLDLWLKLENIHITGSFKERGALTKLLHLTESERKQGIIAMSAGNHAQGVAYHAEKLGIPTIIVMPENTPFVKVERTKSYGATVVLHGETLSESSDYAQKLCKEKNLTFIHPYDDRWIIAGQGTAGLELYEQMPDLDCVVVPIGGGGLISGLAIALKTQNPDIEIVGVEASLYPGMTEVLAGKTPSGSGSSIAEGIAVKDPGLLTRKIVKKYVDKIITLDESELEEAVYKLMQKEKLVAEGAGAAALAAILKEPETFKGKKTGLIICGSNIDSRVLATILMRGLNREGRLVTIRIHLPDIPGALASISKIIGDHRGNIVEVRHDRLQNTIPVKQTEIDITLETSDKTHIHTILADLNAKGFTSHILNS